MLKVAVVTDSNAGISQKQAKEMGITVIPSPFMIDGEEYLEDINLSIDTFYEKMLAGASVSTSQPAIGYVMSVWDELLKEYDQVVYMPISSGLSESCRTGIKAASADYEGKVFVVDNKRVSITLKQGVLDALELANLGHDGKFIKETLEAERYNSDIYIMVDTLKYLKKGGRITPAAAAVGGMLKIKPILLIKGDKLDKFKMMNRTVSNAKRVMLDAVKENINGYMKDIDGKTDNIHLGVAYTGMDDTEAQAFVKMIKEEFPNQEITCDPLSLTIACHIGPSSLAITVCKEVLNK